jgi:hypothetical protein
LNGISKFLESLIAKNAFGGPFGYRFLTASQPSSKAMNLAAVGATKE